MTMTIPFKEIAKVGKRLLVQMAGVCENYKIEKTVENIDFDACPSECALKGFDVEKKADICMNHCPFNRQLKTSKVVYMNERHKYSIKQSTVVEHERLSKYQLLQLVTYHFFVDSRGFASLISTKELAEHLGCTVRTIKNNNKELQRLGLIAFSEYGADLFSVEIKEYEKNHLTKEQGGTGYVQMTKSFMEAIVSMDNVNVMRLAIRALLKYDNEVEMEKKDVCLYSYNDIKRFMPSNINHKKIIDELMQKTASIFTIIASDNYISIQLKEQYNGKVQKKEKENAYTCEIVDYVDEINKELVQGDEILLTNKDTADLVQLAMEYGLNHVRMALSIYAPYIQSKSTPDTVQNIGGFIRTVIKNSIFNRYGKMVA